MPDLTNHLNNHQHKLLLSDKEIAQLCSMSNAWVRTERFKRRHGHEHSLTIDPIMIGKSPRYRATDVFSWIENLERQ